MSKRNVNLRDEWRVTGHARSRIAPPVTRHPSHQYPVALTIAGSDSGGGAGIQADLKTFAAFGVHGASAITCLTAQNPRRILAVESTPAKMVRRQIEAVFQELRPAAVKTGMLLSVENVRTVANFFRSQRRPPLVVDPVMVSTSGASLLAPAAIKVLQERLLPLATLVTPNLRETEILTGGKSRPSKICAPPPAKFTRGLAAPRSSKAAMGVECAKPWTFSLMAGQNCF